MTDVLRFGKKAFTYTVIVTTIIWAIGLAAFLPLTANAATITGGDLIKASGAAVYYYGNDGKRYVFPNETTYKTWYADFSGVKTITDSELAAVSIGGNVTMRAGTKLAKITTDPKVYAIEPGGVLRWVETETVAKTLWGNDWAKRVVDVPDAFFTNYSSGSSLATATYPTGSLVKTAGSADVYYIDGTTKRKIDNEAALTGNLFQSANIVTASDLAAYTAGAIISGKDSAISNVAGSTSVATGPLTIALAADTTSAASVAKGANANFTKVTFTTGANAVNISQIYVTRYGLSANTELENLKFVDANGTTVGNVASLNTDGRALVTFSPNLALAANSSVSYFIRAGFTATANTGITAALGINAASDVTSNAASIAGTFPVKGNYMTTVAVTIGTASVDADGNVTDTTPDAGDTNVVVNKFKVSAGTTEAITIDAVSAIEAGTASLTDTKNIELYSVTLGKSLGEVASWNGEGKVTWNNLNITVDKGNVHRFEIRTDIVSGAGLTVNADISDGSDILVTVKGATYGFFITPTLTTATWTGKGGTGATAVNQTINAGTLVISKSSTTPATGNVAAADNQVLTTWDFEAKGEPIKVTSLRVAFNLTAGFVDGTDETQLTNVKIYDENGVIVAGPQDLGTTNLTVNGTTYEGYITFTDLIIVPIGTHKYSVKAKLANSVSTGDALAVGIPDPDTYVVAKGYNTNDTVTPSPTTSNVDGNTQTVKAATLTATTLTTTPAARNIAAGIQDYLWMVGSLDATNSGEDIQVTSIVVEDTVADSDVTRAAGFADLKNAELWADLTAENSTRGDAYETKISSTEQPSGSGVGDHTLTFSLAQTLTIKKNTFTKIAFIADLSSFTPDGVETHRISFDTDASDITATGAETGTDISANVTPSGAGQLMTISASGVITVSLDSTAPAASLIGGSTNGVTLGVYRLAASNVEDIDLDRLDFTDNGSNDVGVTTYYLYQGSTLIASQAGGATVSFILDDGAVTLPANGHILLTLKGDVAKVDGSTVVNGYTVRPSIADPSGEVGGAPTTTDNDGDVRGTGKSSGATIDGYSNATTDAAVQSNIFTMYEAYPSFAFVSDSQIGSTTTGSSKQYVAKIGITASAGNDITFEDDDGNQLVLQITTVTSAGDAGNENIVLEDVSNGNTLCTVATEIDNTSGAHESTCTFDTNSFTVPAGETRYIKVYADTSLLISTGESLQVSVDSATATDLDWSINSANSTDNSATNSFNKADVIWRSVAPGPVLSHT
ncbi:MAG: hypothetical protein PHD51_00060 [Patescibacteria group bacterium]|nr:hypothetical protein [Patescibacteria group bacterium]MDD5490738.1 hypothetical protein [Patescibacteria group bacterium]